MISQALLNVANTLLHLLRNLAKLHGSAAQLGNLNIDLGVNSCRGGWGRTRRCCKGVRHGSCGGNRRAQGVELLLHTPDHLIDDARRLSDLLAEEVSD